MKHKYLYLIGLAAAVSCAKVAVENENVIQKDVIEAWLSLYYPGVTATGCGIYILEDEPGTGTEVGTDGYVIVDYTTTGLDGVVSETTDEKIARKVDIYKSSKYYGPVVQYTASATIPSGVLQMLEGMKVGGRRKAIIPGWLMTTSRLDTPEEYLNQETDAADKIYDVKIVDYTKDIEKYEIDRLEATSKELYASADSLKKGFYYHRLAKPDNTNEFPSDTTVYINYTGRFLDGKVFDTNIEEVAKDSGIYSKTKTYSPASVAWGEKYTDLKLTFAGSTSETTPVAGFQLTLWQMHSHETGVGMFYSALGYGTEGSSSSIPSYAPLVFEISMVDKK